MRGLFVVVLLAGSWAPAGVAGAARADGGDIVVVTTMDGLVYALDAWSGELSGAFFSGGALWSSSACDAPDEAVGDLSQALVCARAAASRAAPIAGAADGSRAPVVVPGLDGQIYVLDESGDGALSPLSVSVPELVFGK